MKRLLKFSNNLARLLVLIDFGMAIKRWVTKNDSTSDGQTKDKN